MPEIDRRGVHSRQQKQNIQGHRSKGGHGVFGETEAAPLCPVCHRKYLEKGKNRRQLDGVRGGGGMMHHKPSPPHYLKHDIRYRLSILTDPLGTPQHE